MPSHDAAVRRGSWNRKSSIVAAFAARLNAMETCQPFMGDTRTGELGVSAMSPPSARIAEFFK